MEFLNFKFDNRTSINDRKEEEVLVRHKDLHLYWKDVLLFGIMNVPVADTYNVKNTLNCEKVIQGTEEVSWS